MRVLSPKRILTLSAFLVLSIFAIAFGSVLALSSTPPILQASTSESGGDFFISTSTRISGGNHYERDIIPIEEVDLSSSIPGGRNGFAAIRPGQSVDMLVMLTPQWAIATMRIMSFEFLNGAIQAGIHGNTLKVNDNATVGAVITVVAIADGVRSNILSFAIEQNPVESVTILNTETTINQGSSLRLLTVLAPANATHRAVSFDIVQGRTFASVSPDGIIRVNPNLPAGNLTITVRAYSLQVNSIYDELTFNLYVPPRELHGVTTQVEQQQLYDFAIGMPMGSRFVVDVPDTVARICENSGILEIRASAPIDTQITITITTPTDLVFVHVVTVIRVFATKIDVARVFNNSNGIELSQVNPARPGDTIGFDVRFPQPFNVSTCQKNFTISLHSGRTEFASIVGNTLVLKNANTNISNPSFIVRVSSNQNGRTIFEDITITLYIPVTCIRLTQHRTQVAELNANGSLATHSISSLMTTDVRPGNSNIRNATFTIVGGTGAYFVQVIDNHSIRILSGVHAGNLTFILRASAGGQIADRTFTIFVAASSVYLTGPQYAVSSSTSGEAVQLFPTVNSRATAGFPTIKIVEGKDFVYSLTACGKLTVRSGLAPGSIIELRAYRDNRYSEVWAIFIYVPVEELTLIPVSQVQRGDTLFDIVFNNGDGATYMGWEVTGITVNGLPLNLRYFYMSTKRLTIPLTTRGGTIIVINFRSKDKVGNTFTQSFTVAQLNTALYTSPWGADSSGVQIRAEYPQLMINRWTDMRVLWNGFAPSTRGVSYTFSFSGSVVPSVATIIGNRLRIQNTAPGAVELTIRVSISDSINNAETHFFTKTIQIFRPMAGGINLTNAANISTRTTIIGVTAGAGWDHQSNFGLVNLVLHQETGSGWTISGRTITVTHGTATAGTIRASFAQRYNFNPLQNNQWNELNGSLINFTASNRPPVTLRKIDALGGTWGSSFLGSILVIDGLEYSVEIPYYTNRAFRGFFVFRDEWDNNGYRLRTYIFNLHGVRTAHNFPADRDRLHACHNTPFVVFEARGPQVPPGGIFAPGSPNPIHLYPTVSTIPTWLRNLRNVTTIPTANITVTAAASLTIGSNTYNFNRWATPWNSNASTAQTFTFNISQLQTNRAIFIFAIYTRSCVADGTLITLADGSQVAVEDLTGQEQLLVWDFRTGSFSSAQILFVDSAPRAYQEVARLLFANGVYVKIIDAHGFFSTTLNKYIRITVDTAYQYIGQYFLKHSADGSTMQKVRLIDTYVFRHYTASWNPIAPNHFAFFANGLLTAPGLFVRMNFLNIFEVDAETWAFCTKFYDASIQEFGLLSFEIFNIMMPGLTVEFFYAFNGQYLLIMLGRGLIAMDDLVELVDMFSSQLF